ncbi:siderophore-binding protein DesE [Streptomyces capparidis]
MSHSRLPRLSRRGLLAAGGALGFGGLLTACGDEGGSGSGTSGGSGGSGDSGAWTFTDDRKKKITAEKRPERVVAYIGTAAALYDFGVEKQIAGVFGPSKLSNGKPDPQAGDFPVDKTTIIGNAYGEFNIEKYAALRPDLLVTSMYIDEELWYVPAESSKKILTLAPSVGLKSSHNPLPEPIARVAELAASLGADPKAAKVTEAKDRFEKAAERLRRAAKASGGLKVMAASAAADLFFVSDPVVYADLSYYRDLGVELVRPDKVEGGFFEHLSWENADKYPVDLILLDNRTASLQPKDLTVKPTWAKLPAVKAGQIVPWLSEPRFSHAGCAPQIEALAEAIENARKVA